jgi:hypothetical protein
MSMRDIQQKLTSARQSIPAADQKLVLEAVKLFEDTIQNWQEIRKQSTEDMKFLKGDQWDNAIINYMENMTTAPKVRVNLLMKPIEQMENNIRQLNPTIAVHATDELGSEQESHVREGMIRAIIHESDGDQAFLKAYGRSGMLGPGFGFVKIRADYRGTSLKKKITIEAIPDPFKILPDYSATDCTFADAEFWFEYETYDRRVYQDMFPDSILSGNNLPKVTGEAKSWFSKEEIRLVIYWFKDVTKRIKNLYEDGSEGWDDEPRPLKPLTQAFIAFWKEENGDAPMPPAMEQEVLDSRDVPITKIKWIQTNGIEILDRGTHFDSEFPFVAYLGNDYVVDGKRQIHGPVRFAKDGQLLKNFHESQMAKKLATDNFSPWVAYSGQIDEPQREHWEQSHITPQAILYVKPTYGKDGQLLPAPSRGDQTTPNISSMMQASVNAENNVRAVLGGYDPRSGNVVTGEQVTNQQSGAAIDSLAQRGELSNLHYQYNFVMGQKRLGHLLLRALPRVYTAPDVVRIIGADNQEDLQVINKEFSKDGNTSIIKLDPDADYDVIIDTGPDMATKSTQEMQEMLQMLPLLGPAGGLLLGPSIARASDWTYKDHIADLVEAYAVQQMPFLAQMDNMQNLPPAAKQAIAALQAQLAQANQHVQTLAQHTQALEFKDKSNMVDANAKIEVANIQRQTTLDQEHMELIKQLAEEKSDEKIELIKARIAHVEETRKLFMEGIKHVGKMNLEHRKINEKK